MWGYIKDFLLIATPILVAYLSYRSNKKSRNEVMTELAAKLKEKDADTANEIKKIGIELDSKLKEKDSDTANEIKKMYADLEKQKQLSSWLNSQPQTDEYLNKIDVVRRGNVMNLQNLINQINSLLLLQNPIHEELISLKNMLGQLNLPNRNEELFPYEIPILYDYDLMMKKLEKKIQGGE